MTVLRSITLLTFFISFFSTAQKTYFKDYTFQYHTGFSGLHITDSAYYIPTFYSYDSTVSSETHGYGKFDHEGNLIKIYEDIRGGTAEYHFYSRGDITTNFNGNIMNSFVDYSSDTLNGLTGWVHRITEWSPDAGLINEFTIDLRNDSLKLGNFSSIVTSNTDSSYYIAIEFEDLQPTFDYDQGVKLVKMQHNGNISWIKNIFFDDETNIHLRSFSRASDSSFLLTLSHEKWNNWDEHLSFGKGRVHLIDHDGNNMMDWPFYESTYLDLGYAAASTQNGEIVASYLRSENYWADTLYSDSFVHMPALVKFDENGHASWKVDLTPKYQHGKLLSQVPHKLLIDSNHVIGAHVWTDHWYEVPGDIYTKEYTSGYRIFKKNLSDGSSSWERTYSLRQINYGLPPEVDSTFDQNTSYRTYAIRKTNDNGYLFVGRENWTDTIIGNAPNRAGFILKTNCYGFLGAPEAGLEYSYGDDLVVNFHNVSTQAGEFEWIFGDGTTWTTGEDELEVAHTYPTIETYNGMLIAHGCNGEADTIHFEVEPVKHLDPSVVTEGNGYFSIFPNPVLSGEQVFIYIAELEENTELVIRDNSGKLVERIQIDASESAYQQLPRLASGEYYLSLFVNGEKKKTHKLVVTI